MNGPRWIAAALVAAGLWTGPMDAAAQDMPDPSLSHGRAIPAGELANGTVTVRVVREAIGNNVSGQQVRVTADGRTYTATTDDLGRAEFRDIPPGSAARAETTVDGEALTSEPFGVPSTGGLRVILVSGIAEAAARRDKQASEALAAPPVRGVVVFGGDTRIVAELQSDTLRFFYRLDVVNNARTRVDVGGPLIIDLPEGAAGAALTAGSPKAATINGTRLTIVGPFNPGTTTVEISFQLPHRDPDITVTQTWPAAVQQWFVAVEKVANLSMASPQFESTQERTTDSGAVYHIASGAPMPSGSTLTLQIGNLPLHSRVPSRIAIALALAIAGIGVWLSIGRRPDDAAAQHALVKRRDTLLSKLADLESSHRSGATGDEKYLARRQRLMADLEEIYGELDETADPPRGGGEDVAA